MTRPSPQLLRIIQVSDCHVAQDPRTTYRGQRADRNLASLMPAIRRWQPDLLLLTGDVSEDASAAAYGRVSAQLSTAGAPVLALPGNHDDPAMMRRYFPLGPWDGPYVYTRRNWKLVLLDSTEPDRISGVFSAAALQLLDRCLQDGAAENIALALHHQPVPVGSLWIDRYGLEDADCFWSLVERHPRIRCVTWGHVHQDFRSERQGVELFGAPSSVANSLPQQETFTLDLGGPACRWFELHADGGIETGLVRAA